MREDQLHNRTYLKERRRELRNNLTPAEACLWKELQDRQLAGRKFRRQHSIGNFIVDFYCASEKLIVELDGEVHNDVIKSDYDNERNNHLIALGFTVLRFENKLVFEQPEQVLAEIESYFIK